MRASIRERIQSSVAIDENGCWIWKRAIQSKGYGCIRINGKTELAHRVSYTEFVGEIPDDLQLDHKCRVHACVNPEHLEPVTGAVNVARGEGPSAVNGRRTHCKYGHPFDLFNTYVKPNGKRQCRACQAGMGQRWRQRVREASA